MPSFTPVDEDLTILRTKRLASAANDTANPIKRPGRRGYVQAVSFGKRLKAVAVDFVRLVNSPSTGRILIPV